MFFFLTIPILPFASIDSEPRNRKDPIFFLKRNHLSVRSDLSKLKLKTKLEEKEKKKDQLGLAEILSRKQDPQGP